MKNKILRDIRIAKKKLVKKAELKGSVWENFGQDKVRQLEDIYINHKYKNDGVWNAIEEFNNWAKNYCLF